MKFDRFEEIISWQKGKALSLIIYKEFIVCRDYSFRDQIRRASISIMNNIAKALKEKEIKNLEIFYI